MKTTSGICFAALVLLMLAGFASPTVAQVAGLAATGANSVTDAAASTYLERVKASGFANRGGRKYGGVACVGAKQCHTLIKEFGAQCTGFRCNKDHGQTVCWCDT